MSAASHNRAVAAWLTNLIGLCGGPTPISELKLKIEMLTPVVARKFPDDDAFTPESMAEVGSKCGMFYPSLHDLEKYLGDWWEAHRPRGFVMPDTGLGVMDNSWVRFWGMANVENRDRVAALSLIRAKGPVAYEWLMRNDMGAADLAVQKRWDTNATHESYAAEAKRDWSDPEIVRASVQKCLTPTIDTRSLGFLGGLVAKWAPENSPLVPTVEQALGKDAPASGWIDARDGEAVPDPISAPRERFRARTGRNLGELPPDVLEKVRATNAHIAASRAQQEARAKEREGKRRKLFGGDDP